MSGYTLLLYLRLNNICIETIS